MIEVYLERGSKRVFAGALDWPGWCRSGRDDDAALAALLSYAPRYAKAVSWARQGFKPPKDVSALRIVEQLRGDASTDFGAPGIAPRADGKPVDQKELKRLVKLLEACWAAFDVTAEQHGKATLATGPRGGGRTLPKIVAHVLEAEAAYVSGIGGKAPRGGDMTAVREAFVEAMDARARGELPDRGPRGGRRWTARYAARRSAWHALDRAWEIEDRAG